MTRTDAMRLKTRQAVLRASLPTVFCLVALIVLAASVHKKLDHDEHQFIASAYLLAKEGLLPWIDYPYFHVPYLLAPYGLLFQLTDHLLLATRLFSASCSMIMLVLVGRYALNLFSDDNSGLRLAVAVGSVITIAGSPLFTYASGLAWNHDASVLLSVAAAVVFLKGVRGQRPLLSQFTSGGLLGLAIGTRLTVLPLVAPFLAGCYLLGPAENKTRDRLVAAIAFSSGLLLALLPLLALVAAAPDHFCFGNFRYPALNTEYREATGYSRAMSPPLKALFFLERVLADPGNLVIFGLLAFVVIKLGVKAVYRAQDGELALLLTLIVFAFAGSLAPTPSFRQYFYAPLPFVVLASIRAMSLLRNRIFWTTVQRFFIAVTVVCFLRGTVSYWRIYQPGSANAAVAARTHELGVEIRRLMGTGRVLSLAPAIPLEGGLDIYPAFATGPFAWRVAALLTPEERERYGMISPAELGSLLGERPPAGILLGLERENLEDPLLDYVRAAGYRAASLSGGVTLWLPP